MSVVLIMAALQAAPIAANPATSPMLVSPLLQRCEKASTPAERADACATLEAARRAFRVKFLVFSGRLREAEEDANQGLAAHPGPVGTAMLLAARAEARANGGRLGEAERDLNDALRTADMPAFNRSSALSLRADIKARRYDMVGARADYNEAVTADPSSGEARSDRGSFLEARGRYEEALVDFTAATRLSPGWATGFNNLCFVLAAYLRRDFERAQVACDRALALQPGNAAFHDSAGLLAMRRGRWDEALTRYEHAVQLDPADAGYLYGRGIARVRTGHRAEGQTDLAAASHKNADIAKSWAAYGITL